MRPDTDARHSTDPGGADHENTAENATRPEPLRAIPMPGNPAEAGAYEHVHTGPDRQVPEEHTGPDRDVPEQDIPSAPDTNEQPVAEVENEAQAESGTTSEVDAEGQEPAPPATPAQDAGDTAVGVAEVPVRPAGTVYGSGDEQPLLPAGYHDNLRERWHVLQLQFVDDPKGVAHGAAELVDEALNSLRAALHDRKRELDTWTGGENGDGETGDTEELRLVVQHYREFFEKVVAC